MKIILEGIVGSTAYGLAGPDSDVDVAGIYVAPTRPFLGIQPPQDKGSTVAMTDPDITYHEVGKFCRLALKANPSITDMLWLDSYTRGTWEGLYLVGHREFFLSGPQVRNSYLGYATDQFGRIKRRESNDFSSDTKHRTAKHARHLLRLLQQGIDLWSTGEVHVKLEDPERYIEFGEAVQAGDMTLPAKALEAAEYEFNHGTCALPDVPDIARIDEMLINIRQHQPDVVV